MMKDYGLLSVLMPVYQAEKYLAASIDCVLAQSYEHFELILVDDGSTDGSPAICDEYTKKDGRIRVIHKENGGVADARNTTLDAVNGEWIICVDSDDLAHPKMFETMLSLAVEHELPLLWCDFMDMDPESRPAYSEEYPDAAAIDRALEVEPKIEEMSWQEACGCVYRYGNISTVAVVPWSKLYRASLFNDEPKIRYPKGQYLEDTFVYHHIIRRAGKAGWLNIPLYSYRTSASSLMGKGDVRLYPSIIEAGEERLLFFKKEGETELYKKEIISTLRYIIKAYGGIEDAAMRRDLKERYGRIYEQYFRGEKWGAARRLRLGSFKAGYPLYRFISSFERLYNRLRGKD
ncbi:MAG: glycosyltransferase [Lachnospiraceae bacterium]|nr:glycosyltransferase [Lachnospiraceae bacterium]